MKKILFVLPLCALFANCSSSKKVPNTAGPGISNVSVMSNGTPQSMNTTTGSRDWGYQSKHDTTLNGAWALSGMMGSAGTWSTTDTWYMDSTRLATGSNSGTALSTDISQDATNNTTGLSSTTTNSNKTTTANTGRRARGGAKSMIDSSKMTPAQKWRKPTAEELVSADTTVQPFRYWNRIPQISLNANNLVFSGNTGCNSLSGSFSFNANDIEFKRINSSKMACNEYDESAFLGALKKVNSYTINGDQLELKQGNTTMLTFRRR